jgi:hypothetical protein
MQFVNWFLCSKKWGMGELFHSILNSQ